MAAMTLGRFGDGRLDKRGAFLQARLVASGGRGISVRRLGGDRAGEIRLTRFLRNPAVTMEEMVATAAGRTAGRCVGGLYLHPVIAVDAGDGALLGLVHAAALVRSQGRKAVRPALPVEAKESRRWLDGAEHAARVCPRLGGWLRFRAARRGARLRKNQYDVGIR